MLAVRSNYSISSISDFTTPEQIFDLDMQYYRASLRWLLNFTVEGIPPPSSIVSYFWSTDGQLQDSYHYGILLQNFQSFIAFPVWLFNANNFGNVNLHKTTEIIPDVPPEEDLPPEFYTEAAIVKPYEKLKVDPAMFVLFLVLQGSAILFVLGVLLWVWFGVGADSLPELSSFGLFDAMHRTEVRGITASTDELLKAKSSDVLKILNGATVHMKKAELETTELEIIETDIENDKSQVQSVVAAITALSTTVINRSSTT